jgi:hypothetical protein
VFIRLTSGDPTLQRGAPGALHFQEFDMTRHHSHPADRQSSSLTQDQFDELVDDATHAVNNLIPDHLLPELSDRERSSLLIAINDALTPILSTYLSIDS